jgi:hypothetical protein
MRMAGLLLKLMLGVPPVVGRCSSLENLSAEYNLGAHPGSTRDE